jgi:hypothetical protein
MRPSSADTAKQEIRAIEVRNEGQIFDGHFYRIFYAGPHIIYQSQYQFDSSHNRGVFDDSGNMVSSIVIKEWTEMRNKFFVFHRDSSYGYSFEPYNTGKEDQRLPVDTALLSIAGSFRSEWFFRAKPDTATWNADRTELREVYMQAAGKDTPAVHISLYYTNRLDHLPGSLYPALDSARKIRLYKYEYLISDFYSEQQQKFFPAMKFSTEMKEYVVTDPAAILHYVERYKKSIGR